MPLLLIPRSLLRGGLILSGDSPELAQGLPYKAKSMRNRGVSSPMPFLLIPRTLLRGGFIAPRQQAIIISPSCSVVCNLVYCLASRQGGNVAVLMPGDR